MKFHEKLQQAKNYLDRRQPQLAAAVYTDILAVNPDHYEANYSLGMIYRMLGRNDLAIEQIRKSVEIRPDLIAGVMSLGMIQRDAGMLEDSRASLEKVVNAEPENALAHSTLGLVLIDLGELARALEPFEHVVRLEPEDPMSHARMGMLQQALGNKEAAIACLHKVIELSPQHPQARRSLVFLQKQSQYDENIRWMETAFETAAFPDHERMLLGYALGKSFDDLGQYDKAFGFLRKAHQLQRRLFGFSIGQQVDTFVQYKAAFNQSFLRQCKDHAVNDSSPIFVLGMPRSGTSLVEQILASHPLVFGAGEVDYMQYFDRTVEKFTRKPFPRDIDTVPPDLLREISLAYVEKLKLNAGSALKVVDKLPQNFLRVGLIAAMMPASKIVLCERNPLDNCASIYQNLFGKDHAYASDLSGLGEYYCLYRDLMDWWEEVVPGHMYRLSYEQLTTDPANEIAKLLDYCELPFHEDCLSFHKTSRRVKTPSEQQVRLPMFQSSIGRWKNYEKHLGPLIEALG